MRTLAFAFVLSLALPFAAAAERVEYAIPAKGVSCGGTAAHAQQMVQKSVPVESVVADADTGLVTTSFDDADVDLDSVLEALGRRLRARHARAPQLAAPGSRPTEDETPTGQPVGAFALKLHVFDSDGDTRAGCTPTKGVGVMKMKTAIRKASTILTLTADLYREMAFSALRLLPGRTEA